MFTVTPALGPSLTPVLCEPILTVLGLLTPRKVLEGCRKYYGSVSYGFTTIPTYPGGQIGFVLAGKDKVRGWRV